jgi:hypothetical protein
VGASRLRNGQTTGRDPQTQYAKASDGTYLASQAFGEGDQHLLWVPGFATHVEVFWEYPPPGSCDGWGRSPVLSGEYELKGIPDRWWLYRVARERPIVR